MESNYNLVSIAMATYNGERFLEKQLTSILSQTYKHIEIIVCDDCSTDNTVEILKNYSRKYSNINIICNNENLGFKENFEKAISLCKGNYIALADQDDVWMENKIEILVNKIGNMALIHSDATLIDEDGHQFFDSWSKFYKKTIPSTFESYALSNNNVTGCTAMFKKELKDLLLPIPAEIPYHDWWLPLVAYYNGGISYCTDKLIGYRQHDSNHTGYQPNTLSESREDYNKKQLDYLKSLYKHRHILNIPEKSKTFITDMIAFYEYKKDCKYSVKALYLFLMHYFTIRKSTIVHIGIIKILKSGLGSRY